MKISLNWLKQYIELNETTDEIYNLLTNCGLEVSHVTNTIPTKDYFNDLIIGQVMSCSKHPNADRLKLLTVTIGLDRDLEIVCGAPNVAIGMRVVVAPIGTTIESNSGETTYIKNAIIRGVASEGMLCSAYEIGIGKESDGIISLETTLPNGSNLESYLSTMRDVVFDIELTPNRGDACSHIGVARDLSAVLDRELIYPKVSASSKSTHTDPSIEITIDKNASCSRYSGVMLRDIKVVESPQWIKERLLAIGIQPKNIVVDVINYVMHETGQPLHAYDLDKIEGNQLYVKPAPPNTTISTLDNEKRTLNSEELIIADKSGPLCIAGVIGGQRAAIGADTKNIFLECACFSSQAIRKSTRTQNITTDASFRFERSTGRNTIYPLQRAIDLITHVAGGNITADILDITTEIHEDCEILFNYKTLHKIFGIEIPKTDVKRILKRLEIEILEDNTDSLLLRIPPFKTDVVREIDVIEEILRIYGFEHILSKATFNIPYIDSSNEYIVSTNMKLNISSILVANNFYEIRTNPIINSKYYADIGNANGSKIISIINPLSTVMDCMRPNLVFSGLETICFNRNRQQVGELKFFEYGRIYFTENNACSESNRLSLWLSGNYADTKWNEKKRKSSFYDLSVHVYNVLYKLGIENFAITDISNEIFANGINIYVDKKVIASFGKLQSSLLVKMDINETVFYADMDWDALVKCIPEKISYKPVSKFPAVERDISILIDKATMFEEIKELIQAKASNLIEKIEIVDVYFGNDVPANKKSYSIRFTIQSYDKTLNAKEISALMLDIENSLTINLNAKIR